MTGGDDLTDPAAVVARGISYTVDNMTDSVTRGAATTSFIYDGDGRRAKKTAGSNTTVYVNDLYEIINAAATKYIFAGNLRIAKIAGSDIKYFHKDHLGSSTVMTNASGNSVETSEYLPYGGTRDQSGTSVSDYKFTDQELDTSTGLYNYDARLYDLVVGRFISPDPFFSPNIAINIFYKTNSKKGSSFFIVPQKLNRYSYCLNNPLNSIDPSGFDTYSMNRRLGQFDPDDIGIPTDSYISHTFSFTTDPYGKLKDTYSWGTDYDDKLNGQWAKNKTIDRKAAQKAIGQMVDPNRPNFVSPTKEGGAELDKHMEKAYQEREKAQKSGKNYKGKHPLGLLDNCKNETKDLINDAKNGQNEEENQKEAIVE